MNKKEIIRKTPVFRRLLLHFERAEAREWSLYSLQLLRHFKVPWMAWTSSSISPSSLRLIINEISIHSRAKYLEFGAGVSTVYLAEAARRFGGHLTTVEQDAEWLDAIDGLLRSAGTRDYATLLHVPLKIVDENFSCSEWYDTAELDRFVADQTFDLALCDAPISRTGFEMVRNPAGWWLQGRLEEDFCVFLDDVNRRGEQKIAQAWRSEFGWCYSNPWPKAECGIFRPKGKKYYNIL